LDSSPKSCPKNRKLEPNDVDTFDANQCEHILSSVFDEETRAPKRR
jgi:hypothetical protein